MGKTVAVSFEGDSVKIIHASLRGKNITVNKTEIVPENEFDAYLRREKAADFIVTGEFRESFHDVVTTPVVKEQFLRKIIESEIRKVIIQRDFSFIYTLVGEKVVNNKKVQEVFYYAVPKDAVRNIVERFYDNGKTVRSLYPSVFSAAALFDPGIEGEAHLGIFRAGKARFAFFTRKGKIYFLRNYESFEEELSDFDIQNINMTISYCFQSIRINPSSVFVIGPVSESLQMNTLSTAPLACLSLPDYVHCSREIFSEFPLPIASFFAPKTSDILSKEFREIYQLKTFMAYASAVFIALTLLCVGALTFELKNMTAKREQINLTRRDGSDAEKIFADYSARQERINQYLPVVEFLNRPAPNIQRLLISLGGIDFRELKLSEINASFNDDNGFSVSLKGVSLADTYASMQDSLDTISKDLTRLGNIEITDRAVDIKDKAFTIEMNYKAAAE